MSTSNAPSSDARTSDARSREAGVRSPDSPDPEKPETETPDADSPGADAPGTGPPEAGSGEGSSASGSTAGSEFRVRPFRASPWLPGSHLQTLGGKFLRSSGSPSIRRLRLDTPDGDFLDLDLGPEPAIGAEAPVVLVLHGLEGSSRRGYVREAYRQLLGRGLRPAGMNFRGCSGEPNRKARFYHSGETGDLALVLDRLRDRFPGRPFGALGFSLGGNMLLKYLGEAGSAAGEEGSTAGEAGSAAGAAGSAAGAAVTAGVAVSVPFDLAAGARRLEEGPMGSLYTHYFLRMLRQKIRDKSSLLRDRVDTDEALRARTLRAFDDAATAPLHGFRDAEEYYRRSSSQRFLSDIRVPTLLLQARDDPFLPEEALPLEAIRDNPALVPAITRRGGHVGFVEGPPWNPRFWAEEQAARFLALHLRGSESGPATDRRGRRGDQPERGS